MGTRGTNRLPTGPETADSHLTQASWAHAAGTKAAQSGMHDAATKWFQQAAEHRALAHSVAKAGLDTHHSDVPKSGGGHGGNPNHDEHGRFT